MTWKETYDRLKKPSATKRKIETVGRRKSLANDEEKNKAKCRRRDRGCRFPQCPCQNFELRLASRREVSHDQHKGMGGNPKGDRSATAGMVTLCLHRHQTGRISRHAGTLKTKALTREGYDGPVAWLVDISVVVGGFEAVWYEVARELRVGVLEPLTPRQQKILTILSGLEY